MTQSISGTCEAGQQTTRYSIEMTYYAKCTYE